MKHARLDSGRGLGLALALVAASALPGRSFAQQRPSAAPTASAVRTASAAPSAPSAGASAVGPGLAALTADQVVANMQAYYDRTRDYEADFTQVSRNRLANTQRSTAGHVRFQRGGRMRWEYTSPAGDLIVSDGSRMWTYELASRQAFEVNIRQAQIPSAFSFLMGTGRLANDFTFRLMTQREAPYPTGYVVEARPIVPTASYERVMFYVEGGLFRVVKASVIDAQGNPNTFVFTNPVVNVSPPAATFQWSPPAGTQVVRP